MIISLNVNKFGGNQNNAYGDDWSYHYIDAIIEFIKEKNLTQNDCVILHEVNLKKEPYQYFISKLPNNLIIHLPTNLKNKSPIGSTIAVTTGDSCWKQRDSIDDGINFYNKTIQLKHTKIGLAVLGVHMPSSIDAVGKKLWDNLLQFSNAHKQFLIIGDFNVFKEGDDNYDVFNTLSKNYELDAWIQAGKEKDTRTFVGNTRVDYALTNVAFTTIDITNHLIKDDITDHEAVIIEY
ncbi:hypothetical protein [Macrococcus capreoli]|uniref:hypothetical protein n=1 Tax=Macrococcus capreoli TaxID=2982690 RepID=UPI003F435C47